MVVRRGSGPNLLDKPSLAVRLPNGLIAANDDYGDRVILIDPRTSRIVWQYGHTGVASSAPGYLSKPDGLDFLPAKVVPRVVPPRDTTAASLVVSTIGRLPVAASRLAVVASAQPRHRARRPHRRLVLRPDPRGPTGRLPASARCPPRRTTTRPCCSASGSTCSAAARRPRATRSCGSDSTAGPGRPAPSASRCPTSEPRSSATPPTCGRLHGHAVRHGDPRVSRFDAKARGAAPRGPALRRRGLARRSGLCRGRGRDDGTSDAVYRFDPASGRVAQIATLPVPVAHAPLVALGGSLYLIGGDGSDAIWRIQPGGRVTLAGRLPHPLANAAAVAVGTRCTSSAATAPTPSCESARARAETRASGQKRLRMGACWGLGLAGASTCSGRDELRARRGAPRMPRRGDAARRNDARLRLTGLVLVGAGASLLGAEVAPDAHRTAVALGGRSRRARLGSRRPAPAPVALGARVRDPARRARRASRSTWAARTPSSSSRSTCSRRPRESRSRSRSSAATAAPGSSARSRCHSRRSSSGRASRSCGATTSAPDRSSCSPTSCRSRCSASPSPASRGAGARSPGSASS